MKDWTRMEIISLFGSVLLSVTILLSTVIAKTNTTNQAYKERDEAREELQLIKLQFSNWNDIINNKPIKEIKVKK